MAIDAVAPDGLTIRDLVAALTWVQDRLREAPGGAGIGDDPALDQDWLLQRQADICAELRRRRGATATAPAR